MNRHRLASRALCVAALAAGLASCASREDAKDVLAFAEAAQADDVLTPVVRGGANGLEVLWFVCRDGDSSLAPALAPYLYQPSPLSEETRETLRQNGLRLVVVPLADLGTIRDGLDMVGVTERAWLGWSLVWSEAFRARSFARGTTVLIDDELVSLPQSSPRLLARSWSTPTPEGDRVRVELTTQVVPSVQRVAPYDPLAGPVTDDLAAYELSRGDVLPSLAFEAELQPGFAYLLVPESPESDWSPSDTPTEREATATATPDDGFEPAERGWAFGSGGAFGPFAPEPLTMGEAMLTSWDPFETDDSGAAPAPKLKAVIVLVPRAESKVRLLPRFQTIAADAAPVASR